MELLDERMVDPVALAQRVASQRGRRTKYGYWEPPIKGQHIPLTSFNARQAERVDDRRYEILGKLGHTSGRNRDQDEKSLERYHALFTPTTVAIRDLRATQPFVRTDDVERLKGKIADTQPGNVRVARYRGNLYVLDGHHSVMAARLRGDTSIPVMLANFDPTK